jgi:hypothetical protein
MRSPMRLPKRKSRFEQLRSTIAEPVARTVKQIPIRPSAKTAKAGLIAAGGITGLTAASAAISSRRQRSESQDDS